MSDSSCHFLLSLMDDIFDYSKIKLGHFILEYSWFSLEDLIDEIFLIMVCSSKIYVKRNKVMKFQVILKKKKKIT